MTEDPRVDVFERLAHLIKEAAEIQTRLMSWTVDTPDDRKALEEDLRKLQYHIDQAIEHLQ